MVEQAAPRSCSPVKHWTLSRNSTPYLSELWRAESTAVRSVHDALSLSFSLVLPLQDSAVFLHTAVHVPSCDNRPKLQKEQGRAVSAWYVLIFPANTRSNARCTFLFNVIQSSQIRKTEKWPTDTWVEKWQFRITWDQLSSEINETWREFLRELRPLKGRVPQGRIYKAVIMPKQDVCLRENLNCHLGLMLRPSTSLAEY